MALWGKIRGGKQMNAARYQLPIKECIQTAWVKVHGAKTTIWIAMIILAITIFIVGLIDHLLGRVAPRIELIFYFIGQIIIFLLQLGLIYLGIRRAQDLPIQYQQILRGYEKLIVFKGIGVYILQGLILVLPLLVVFFSILMLLPIHPAAHAVSAPAVATATTAHSNTGIAVTIFYFILLAAGTIAIIFLSIRTSLSIAFVVDQAAGPIQAILSSFKSTRHNVWRLIGIYLLQFVIILVSIIPLGIGLIWSLPFALVLYGTVYKHLSLALKGPQSSGPEEGHQRDAAAKHASPSPSPPIPS
jgi:hypothetical protein